MIVDLKKDKKINFIIGIGRSGTTVLVKLLNTLQDVHCMPEANFLVFFLNHYKNKQSFSLTEINLLFDQIELYALSHPWVGWEFSLKEVKLECLDVVKTNSRITYQELCKCIYQNFKVVGVDKTNASILIDKNPSYTIFVNKINQSFPESKFIWIVRDYRANILSRKQSVFLKSPNVVYNAVRWLLYNKKAYEFYLKNKHKVLLIKYEDLVSNYEDVELKLIQFLNISSSKELNLNEGQQKVDLEKFKMADKFKDRFLKKYSDLNKTLNSDRLSAWKEQLTEKEIEICDVICSSVAKKIGYNSISNVSVSKKTQILISNFVPICLGYCDIVKDKILYYISPSIKIKRLHKKYVEFGFIKK